MLNNKNIVVTGALQGIGKETVNCLANFGANIWACAHYIDDEFLDFCSRTSSSHGIDIYPLEADFASIDSVKEMSAKILKSKLPINGLVNVAGVTKDAIFPMTSPLDIRAIYDINVVATLTFTQAICKRMVREGSGSIVNISSISALDGVEGQMSYSSSKSALIGSTKTLAKELGTKNIRVNCIAPGVIDTEMNLKVPKEVLETRLVNTSLKRMGKPSEVADLIAFLMSDMSSYVTGQVIRIDGGMA